MIIDALLSAEPHLKIAKRVFEPEKSLHLTDNIMPFIEASTESVTNLSQRFSSMFDSLFSVQELADARAIFDRIHARDLYKCVDFKVIDWPMGSLFQKHITATSIVQACKALSAPSTSTEDRNSLSQDLAASLQESDVIVSSAIMHFGMKTSTFFLL